MYIQQLVAMLSDEESRANRAEKDICFNGPERKVGYKLKIINGFPEIVPILHYNS